MAFSDYPWKSKALNIFAPHPDEVDRFCAFIENELVQDGIDTIMMIVRYNYEFTSHPECRGDYPLSKTDFYLDGLTGGQNSAARRDALAARLALPRGMNANALLAAVRMLCTYEEYRTLVDDTDMDMNEKNTQAPGGQA